MTRLLALLSLPLALALAPASPCQLQPVNCRMLAHVDKFPGAQTPNNNYAGVWGMVRNGREYALVTARTGTIVYDCTTPTNPVEVAFIAGPNGGSSGYFWREASSYGDHAYTSSEHGPLQVIDMAASPPALAGTFGSLAHSLAIDPGTGRLWANGGASASGGCEVFDLVANPRNPPRVGTYSAGYVHDCLPIRGWCYLAMIFDGNMRILNTSAFPTMTVASTTRTPGAFTHNVWVTDDDRIAVTCDENQGGCLTVYDVTNKAAPAQRSTWCSPAGATVHNVFLKSQVAHFSSYSAGYYAVDVSVPASPRLIASFDTSTYGGSDYHGCWGCYPFQPSGVIYLSDMQSGFWIVEPTCGVARPYGNGTAGAGGQVPLLDYSGGFAQVNRATFGLKGAKVAPNAPVALVLGAARTEVPVLGITLLVDVAQPVMIVSAQADAQGNVAIPVPIPNAPGLANQTFYAQLISADAAGPQGLAASRGFTVTICP